MGAHRGNPFARNSLIGPREPILLDCYGRELLKGDLVFLLHPQTVPYRVVHVRPNLHPAAPPNTLMVTVVAQVAMDARAGQAHPQLALVLTAEAQGIGVDEAKSPNGQAEEPPEGSPAVGGGSGPRLVSEN